MDIRNLILLKDKVKNLEKDICIINFINYLKLSQKQMERLIYFAKKAEPIHQNTAKIYENFLPSYEIILEKFLQEDIKGNGFSKKVEQQTAHLHHREIIIKKQFCDAINIYEEKVKRILTSIQLTKVENYNPRKNIVEKTIPKKFQNKHKFKNPIEFLFEYSRKLSKSSYQSKKYKIAKRIKNTAKNKNSIFAKLDEKNIISLMDKARILSEDEFEAQKENIVKSVFSNKTIRLKKELKEIKKGTYGGVGNIGEYLLNPRAIDILEKMYYRKFHRQPKIEITTESKFQE